MYTCTHKEKTPQNEELGLGLLFSSHLIQVTIIRLPQYYHHNFPTFPLCYDADASATIPHCQKKENLYSSLFFSLFPLFC